MKRAGLILKITLVLAVVNYSFWKWIKDYFEISVFHPTQALCFVGYVYVIYEYTRLAYRQNKKLSGLLAWAEVALAATVSSLVDEIFFDPTKLGINEYVAFLIIILIAIYNDFKRKRQARNSRR